MKREIIIILGVLLVVIIYIALYQAKKPGAKSLEFYKTEGDRLIKTSQFSPFEQVTITFPAIKKEEKVEWVIRDAKWYPYQTGNLTQEEISRHSFSFFAGHALGKQQVFLTHYFDKGKVIRYRVPFELVAETRVQTNNTQWDSLYPLLKEAILKNRGILKVDDKEVIGYRSPDTLPIFIRDHRYQMKGFKYFEEEMKSAVDYFLSQQQPDGHYLELVWENPKTKKMETLRNDVDADVEYLMVQAVYNIWQSTGDDEWVKQKLSQLEKGLNYTMTDPFRWSKEYQLVKRPFTIDTWDFEYHNVGYPYNYKKSKMGVMHGDNSGMYDACRKMGELYHYFGEREKADLWNKKAENFKKQMNKVCWNGKYYTHQVHIDPVNVNGVDEKKILSLSNPYDINRGVTDHKQAVSIIQEYQNRKKTLKPSPFAEWFSIQPWFPAGSFETTVNSWTYKAGEYVNGGILPLVGGELAKASFNHGFESYGVSILNQYQQMISSTGRAYLWYYWDGKPGLSDPENFSSDGWGAAAMLSAFMEGLAGVQDESKLFMDVNCNPRWVSANVTTAMVIAKYGASDGYFAYQYKYDEKNNEMNIHYTGSGKTVHFSILLPQNKNVREVTANNQNLSYTISTIENSRYLQCNTDFNKKNIHISFST